MMKKEIIYDEFVEPNERYRGRPFWAWNTDITSEKIEKQVEMFSKMGFGGFVIHSRNGLRTEYLGDHFISMVRLALKRAQKYGLKVWLYDEDRWPSGSAGGIVTVDKRYRVKYLTLTKEKPTTFSDKNNSAVGDPYVLAAFKLQLDENGYLKDYCLTDGDADIYACVYTAEDSPRYNGQNNVDVLNDAAIKRFIDVTYKKYYAELGEYFGNTVEAIFTDEPHGKITEMLKFSELELLSNVVLAWTDDFADTYFAEYREDIVSHIPELLWERADGKYSTARYRYHEHVAYRFRKAYSMQIGDWCRKHGIKFTGHFLLEEALSTQTSCTRDVMRCYADEDIPGIDILLGGYEFFTAVQCRSVAHQLGREQVMSELYGVNNWDTDFREYLHQGNWQAAMGINVRIPHLTWMSMLGEGKRDYPATFGYQSPWFEDYHLIEDYFSRLNVILTNGKPIVRVAVVNPIESLWILSGVKDKTYDICKSRDDELAKLFDWLSFSGIDFDFVSEALLPYQSLENGNVENIRYDAVIIPNCITIRSTTIEALRTLKNHGVRIIFAGSTPVLVDGIEDSAAKAFSFECENIDYNYLSFENALKRYRSFELLSSEGERTDRYIYQERELDGERWLFFSSAKKIEDTENNKINEYVLKLNGKYVPMLYDAMTGEKAPLRFEYIGDKTVAKLHMSNYDIALICLKTESVAPQFTSNVQSFEKCLEIELNNTVAYEREEENVCLLDMAEYSFDGNEWYGKKEVLAIDAICRERFGLPSITGKTAVQPWCIEDDASYDVWLRFRVKSKIQASCKLAFEKAKKILLNGNEVLMERVGWYVDEDISVVALPTLNDNENIIDVMVSVTKTVGIEPMYLIGDFDVALCGTEAELDAPSKRLSFGSVVSQGLPFYSGTLTYRTSIETADGNLVISVNHYRCELVKVYLDGELFGNIILPPYSVEIPNVKKGSHVLEIKCVGNRHNTFGSLHWSLYDPYYGPLHWHKKDDAFSREYRLKDFGIMKCPKITFYSK